MWPDLLLLVMLDVSEPRRGRILFIGIDFYAYTGYIRDAFSRLGFESDWFPIEDASFLSKTFKKLFPDAYRKRLDRYHRDIINKTALIEYDFVVFIQCHHVSIEDMQLLRRTHPEAKFILYNWDSVTTHDFRPWIPYFDRVATFDPVDADSTGSDYLPLFAARAYFDVDDSREKEFDLYFVGAIVTMNRFNALAKLYDYCCANDIRVHFHLRCSPPIRLMLWWNRRYLPGLTLKSIGFSDIIDLIERSRGVFDFANHKQTGYTMRFIENMCADKKVITENGRVLHEDFYSEDRFLVIRDLDFSGMKAFLDRPVSSQFDKERFSIDSWARELLSV